MFALASPQRLPTPPQALCFPINYLHVQARAAVLLRIARQRPQHSEPACMVTSLIPALEARHSHCPLTWVNRPLIDLCDVPFSVEPLVGINVWIFPEKLVFQSAETAAAYFQSCALLRHICEAFLRGEAAEAEGTVLHISRLGRTTICDFVLALVPMPHGEMPECMLALWPRSTPHTGFVVQARYTLHTQASTPPLALVSSDKPPSSATPLALHAQQFKFACPKAGRKWHPYAPDKT